MTDPTRATPVEIQYAPTDADQFFGKVTRLLIPFLFALYVVGILDRINIGFAALTMQKDLGLSEQEYSFGAGIFFLGYFILEVPSNLMLERVGARRWIARIMLTWGVIACAMMFVKGFASLTVMRLLLGAAEAGFFPGMVLYLTYWYPVHRRAKAMGWFMTSIAIAGVVGGPVSALCLKMDGLAGIKGWQWLFLLEGIPSIVLGLLVLLVLPDGPQDARWVTDAERVWLREELGRDAGQAHHRHDLGAALRDWRLWLCCAIYFFLIAGLYTFGFFAPKVLKLASPGLSDAKVSLLVAIPYLVAAVTMVWIGRHSDRTGERRWHVAIPAFAAAAGYAMTAFAHGTVMTVSSLSLAAVGIYGVLGTFWTLPTVFLRGTAAAGGIAIVNSIGCLSGWPAPTIVGHLYQSSHNYRSGLLTLAGSMAIGGLLVFAARVSPQLPREQNVLS